MSNRVFQIQSESSIELILVETTLETATDVTYTMLQFTTQIINDSGWEYMCRTWDTIPTYHYVNKPEIIRQVQLELVKHKEVTLEMSERAMAELVHHNLTFKRHGFMYRPSKEVFVAWRERPKKVKQTKVVAKAILNNMKNMCLSMIVEHIQDKYGFYFDLKSCCNAENQVAVVKFGRDNGFAWEQLMVAPGTYGDWQYYDRDTKRYIGRTVMEYLQYVLSDTPDKIDPTYNEFKKWYEDSLK